MKPRRGLTVVLGVAALAAFAAAACVGGPRIVRRVRLERAIERARAAAWTGKDLEEALEALASFGDADSVLTLMDLCEGWEREPSLNVIVFLIRRVALRHAVEVFAVEPAPRDPRPTERLEAWRAREIRKSNFDEVLKFYGFYLLAELDQPRYSSREVALEHAGENFATLGTTGRGLSPLKTTIREFEIAMKRTLVVQDPLTLPLGDVSFALDPMDPMTALRAWAALNGCAVRAKDERTLEVYRP